MAFFSLVHLTSDINEMFVIYFHFSDLQKMLPDPHLVVDGESRFDLAQGELGESKTKAGVSKDTAVILLCLYSAGFLFVITSLSISVSLLNFSGISW